VQDEVKWREKRTANDIDKSNSLLLLERMMLI
jgi:hypothetical protein